MTMTQVRGSVSLMRQDVMRWRKEVTESAAKQLIAEFDAGYKLLKSKMELAADLPKNQRVAYVWTLYSELLGWHEGVYQSLVAEREEQQRLQQQRAYEEEISRKRVTEIKKEPEAEQVTEIKRGGYRDGAGRKKSGYEVRKVSLALPPELWAEIDRSLAHFKQRGHKLTQSDMLRQIVLNNAGLVTKIKEKEVDDLVK